MANRRLQTLTRHYRSILSSNTSTFQYLRTIYHLRILAPPASLQTLTPKLGHIFTDLRPYSHTQFTILSNFSSGGRDDTGSDEEEDDEDDDEEMGESDDDEDDDVSVSSSGIGKRVYTLEEKEKLAADIGYKVIGPLERSDKVFKLVEPVFAVIQIGSHQFKVSNGDCIYTERLKFCEVNDKLILNKVLMLGSRTQTMIGRPILPEAAVHAVVEEHALDAKVIIFKKKRRKNYRRKKGHRQELTKLRITDVQGIEKPETPAPGKTEKPAHKKVEEAPPPVELEGPNSPHPQGGKLGC